MKKIEFFEPPERVTCNSICERLADEAPLLYERIRKDGYLWLVMGGFMRGVYFPPQMRHLSGDFCCGLGYDMDFVCLPPELDGMESWRQIHSSLYNTTAYVEKGSVSEQFLRSRNRYAYRVKTGLPVVDGRRIERSEHVVIWLKGADNPDAWIRSHGTPAPQGQLGVLQNLRRMRDPTRVMVKRACAGVAGLLIVLLFTLTFALIM